MTQTPAFLIASAALLVAAVGGGLALQEAGRARAVAAAATDAQIAKVRALIEEGRGLSPAAAEALIEARLRAVFPEQPTTLSAEIANLRAEVATLRSVSDRLAEVEQRVAALEAAARATLETFEMLRAEIAALGPAAAAEAVEHQRTDREPRFHALTTQAGGSAREVAQAEVYPLRGQTDKNRGHADATAAATIEAILHEIATLRQTTATAQTVDGMGRLLEETRAQIAALAAAIPETHETLSSLRERLERLEARPEPTAPTLEQLLADASPAAREALGHIGLAATVANPQQVMESLSAFAQRQRRAEAQGRLVPPALLDEIFAPDSGALRAGPPGAQRRVAILTDHNCPFCRRAVQLVQELIQRGDVEIVIYEMPILSLQSHEAALVAAAAARLDARRALDLYLAVGTHEGRLDGAAMLEKAAGLGFNREALRQEAEREETRQTVARSLDLGRRLGVTGTPGFVVQDLLIQGLQPDQVLQALTRPR